MPHAMQLDLLLLRAFGVTSTRSVDRKSVRGAAIIVAINFLEMPLQLLGDPSLRAF